MRSSVTRTPTCSRVSADAGRRNAGARFVKRFDGRDYELAYGASEGHGRSKAVSETPVAR